MMHEIKIMNVRNIGGKKEGKCFADAWPLRHRKDHDRGHDRDGVRPPWRKKKSVNSCLLLFRCEQGVTRVCSAGKLERGCFGYEGEIPPHRIPSLGFLWFAFPLNLLLIARTNNV